MEQPDAKQPTVTSSNEGSVLGSKPWKCRLGVFARAPQRRHPILALEHFASSQEREQRKLSKHYANARYEPNEARESSPRRSDQPVVASSHRQGAKRLRRHRAPDQVVFLHRSEVNSGFGAKGRHAFSGQLCERQRAVGAGHAFIQVGEGGRVSQRVGSHFGATQGGIRHVAGESR